MSPSFSPSCAFVSRGTVSATVSLSLPPHPARRKRMQATPPATKGFTSLALTELFHPAAFQPEGNAQIEGLCKRIVVAHGLHRDVVLFAFFDPFFHGGQDAPVRLRARMRNAECPQTTQLHPPDGQHDLRRKIRQFLRRSDLAGFAVLLPPAVELRVDRLVPLIADRFAL